MHLTWLIHKLPPIPSARRSKGGDVYVPYMCSLDNLQALPFRSQTRINLWIFGRTILYHTLQSQIALIPDTMCYILT